MHFQSNYCGTLQNFEAWRRNQALKTMSPTSQEKEMSLTLNFMDVSSLCQVCGGIYVGERVHSWIHLSLYLIL